ncbi:hypothetical protein MAPG_10759, partial [Magnaporthiopsis poae ATCC 64411]
ALHPIKKLDTTGCTPASGPGGPRDKKHPALPAKFVGKLLTEGGEINSAMSTTYLIATDSTALLLDSGWSLRWAGTIGNDGHYQLALPFLFLFFFFFFFFLFVFFFSSFFLFLLSLVCVRCSSRTRDVAKRSIAQDSKTEQRDEQSQGSRGASRLPKPSSQLSTFKKKKKRQHREQLIWLALRKRPCARFWCCHLRLHLCNPRKGALDIGH